MGDLRNKLAKQERDEAHRRYMARRYPPKPAPVLPRCLCGLTYWEVPVMWAAPGGRHEAAKFFCPDCLPPELLREVARNVADLLADET